MGDDTGKLKVMAAIKTEDSTWCCPYLTQVNYVVTRSRPYPNLRSPSAMLLRPTLLFCAGYLSVSAAALHVDPKGDDQAAGSEAKPFRTIQRAADLAQPGDTVLVAPGIYRERIAPPRGGQEGKPITFQAVKPHEAIVRGSDVWAPKWQKVSAGIYAGKVEEALFTDSAHRDGANPFRIPSSSTPYGREGQPEFERKYPNSDKTLNYNLGQVFVADEIYTQEPKESALKAKSRTWRYDAATGVLAIHFPDDKPQSHVVEITTKRRLFAPHQRQLQHIVVDGFTFERCGNQYPTNFWEAEHPEWQHAGMVGTRSGKFWIIRNNIIRFANGIGLDFGNEGNEAFDLETGTNGKATGARGHLIEGNVISDNGAAGTASYNGSNLIIRANTFERNNRLMFTGKKRWESAGLKLHNPNNSVIEGNLIRDNYVLWGIWCDGGAGQDTRIAGNTIIHQGVGIDFEIGSAKPCVVENNILIENDIGVRTRESGGVSIQHNLFVGTKTVDVEFSLERKRSGSWSAAHCAVRENLLIGSKGLLLKLTAPDQFQSEDRKLDGNIYAVRTSEPRFAFDKGAAMNFADWQSRWKTYNGAIDAEKKSHLVAGCGYRFDAAKMELNLTLGFDPKDATYPGLKQGVQVLVLKR